MRASSNHSGWSCAVEPHATDPGACESFVVVRLGEDVPEEQRVDRRLDAVRERHLVGGLRVDDPNLEPVVGLVDHEQVRVAVDELDKIRVESVLGVERRGGAQRGLVDGVAGTGTGEEVEGLLDGVPSVRTRLVGLPVRNDRPVAEELVEDPLLPLEPLCEDRLRDEGVVELDRRDPVELPLLLGRRRVAQVALALVEVEASQARRAHSEPCHLCFTPLPASGSRSAQPIATKGNRLVW